MWYILHYNCQSVTDNEDCNTQQQYEQTIPCINFPVWLFTFSLHDFRGVGGSTAVSSKTMPLGLGFLSDFTGSGLLILVFGGFSPYPDA